MIRMRDRWKVISLRSSDLPWLNDLTRFGLGSTRFMNFERRWCNSCMFDSPLQPYCIVARSISMYISTCHITLFYHILIHFCFIPCYLQLIKTFIYKRASFLSSVLVPCPISTTLRNLGRIWGCQPGSHFVKFCFGAFGMFCVPLWQNSKAAV